MVVGYPDLVWKIREDFLEVVTVFSYNIVGKTEQDNEYAKIWRQRENDIFKTLEEYCAAGEETVGWHKIKRTGKQESNHGSPGDDFSLCPKRKGKPLKE